MDATFCSITFQYLWIFYTILLLGQIANTQSNNCPNIFQKTDRSDKEIKVEKSSLQKCDLFYDLIVILEQLNILIPRNTSCYALQRIVQSYDQTNPQSNFQTVRISFQFQENFKTSLDSSMCTSSPVLYNTSSQRQVDSENDKEKVNATLALPKAGVNDNDSSVLSHTQVVVIATCSAVIGTFFILAAALRIRNYVKRLREEQQTSRRSNNYRLPLTKGANTVEGHSRKSSSSSRNSQQNSLLDRDGNDYHRNSNSPSACRQPLLDAMPRLIVTAPSTAASTPGDSHSSIQFIDEEVEGVKRNDDSVEANEKILTEEEIGNNDTTETCIDQIQNGNSTPCESELENPTAVEDIESKVDLGNENDIVNTQNDIVNTQSSCESQQGNAICDSIPQATLQEMHSVTIGLTQSDNSLSNNNSYCYGNQVEYSGNAEYENMGYSPVLEYEVNSIQEETDEGNCQEQSQNEKDNTFSKYFCDNNTATSFEQDESKSVVNDNMHSKKNEGRPNLKDTHNVVSLDQYEQRHRLQRQDRTLTQTNSFESDAF